MAIANEYNQNPASTDSVLKKRQERANALKEQGLLSDTGNKIEPVENQKVLGVEITPDTEDKSFLRKVGEDAAMLAYAVPTAIAQVVTNPLEFIKTSLFDENYDITKGAIGQSVRDLGNADYYKAHPLLGLVNLVGFTTPIAGAAKTATIKTATASVLRTTLKESVGNGIKEDVIKGIIGNKSVNKTINEAVRQASTSGNTGIMNETIRNILSNSGIADNISSKVGNLVADNLYQSLSVQSKKMKALDAIVHPVRTSTEAITKGTASLRSAIFGTPEKTAVSKIYGADVVKKNPEGFLNIERWAEAQAAERGIENTVGNRQRIMNEWVEQNSQWASLTPEERISHFENYAKQDLTRLKIHNSTGMDIVTSKALPENYVEAMVNTVKETADDISKADLIEILKDNFGNDFSIHEAEILNAIKNSTNIKEAIIGAISKLGDARALVSFSKFSPEIKSLVKDIEKTGYRIAYAPKNKQVSYVSDIFEREKASAKSTLTEMDVQSSRSALGRWVENFGLSAESVVEGAAEYSYRQNFTQRLLNEIVPKYGNVFNARSVKTAGNVSIPAEKLFQWLDKNKNYISASEKGENFLPTRTVFDLTENDLVRAGFSRELAKDIKRISNDALRKVPASVTGMADKVVNFMRTSNKPFGQWMSNWYDKYLKTAYKFRYDLSPFFAAQQWIETRINASLLTKDLGVFSEGIETTGIPGIPGSKKASQAIKSLGTWTAEKLTNRLKQTEPYLKNIISEPTLAEQMMVKDEVLGTLQKTMLDYTSSPDIVNISSSGLGKFEGIAGEAAFKRSVQSRNFWYAQRGESSVRMATQISRTMANKFGFTLDKALEYTIQNGKKIYKNPQMLKVIREVNQDIFHYKEGILTSPLMKTLNVVWFPLRFQVKTLQMAGNWLSTLSPINRGVVINNWANFANWAGTDEGIEWRRTNKNIFYNILNYSLAYGQIGQSIEAVSKGRIFGGNTGLIGGVPFGFLVNIARELAYLPSDPDQYDPKTGKEYKKTTPKEVPSIAALSVAIEQLIIQITPGMPFYTLTGGVISGVSPRGWITKLVRMGLGGAREFIEGGDPTEGYQQLQRDFKKVPLDYNRLAE